MAITYVPSTTDPAAALLASRFYIVATGDETSPRTSLYHLNSAPASQTLSLTYFTAQKTETITQVRTTTGSTARANTPTLQRIGIYSEAANGDLTLVASTPNDTALWNAAYTHFTKSLTASFTKVAGRVYAVGILTVSSAAISNLVGLDATTVGIIGELLNTRPRIAGTVVSNTDLPSSVLNGNIGQSTTPCYALLLPA